MDELMRKLNDSDAKVREAALDEIGALKPDNALELLRPFLLDDDPEIRGTAACNMGLIGDKRAIPYLIRAAESDPSEHVRAEALSSLSEYHGPEILECLTAEVGRQKKSRRPRQEVAIQLKRYDSEDSIRCLVTLLQDDDVYVRINAADSLYELNRLALRGVWERALDDSSPYISEVAERALAELSRRH